jgi:septal ring factor EnvC (AmiA/AmiB activator)
MRRARKRKNSGIRPKLSLHFATMKNCLALGLMLVFAAPQTVLPQETELTQIKERELEAVRQQISDLKQSMDRRANDRDRITGELQAAEVIISEKRIHLKELERQRQFSERKMAELGARQASHEEALDEESRLLAAQVQAAYMSGRQERIKLLLNQNDPAALGRLLTYYRYFSDYRGQNIEAVSRIIDELDALKRQAAIEEQRLAGLARARYAELTELNGAQEERQVLLVRLKTRIAEEGSEVDRLAAQEQDLSRLLAELTSILSDYPISSEDPFSRLKGKLTWPVAGRLTHDFGQPRASGRLKWNGVVLSAPRGREIRAIYHGRVVFADWLAGMGLLVIVDHGEGYMSLYGYNETTLKLAGDWVAPGDVIATVGESGGQARPALYFELRKGTRPVNPRAWFSRSPKT